MRMRLAKWLTCFMLILMLNGCWSSTELNDLAISMGIAVDEEKDGQLLVSIQVVDAGEVSATKGTLGRSPVVLYQAKGKTVSEAIQRMSTTSSRSIYNSHLRILVISEALARNGINDVLDYISRDRQFRTDFSVIIAKGGRAEDTLKILTPIEQIPAVQLFRSLANSQKEWAPTVVINFDDLIQMMVSGGRQPVAPGIVVIGDADKGSKRSNITTSTPNNRLKYVGLAVFKEDQLIGWLNETESRAFNFIRGNVINSISNLTCDDGKNISLEVQRTQSNMKTKLLKDKLSLSATLKVEANVAEVACQIQLTKEEEIMKLEKKTEKYLSNIMSNTLKRVQTEFKSDIFGFGNEVHRHYPDYWKKLNGEWNAQFAQTPVTVQVDVKIRQLGTVSESMDRLEHESSTKKGSENYK
ncbi:Ger(x)C family spore germination protein [Paenibacillus sp. MMS18-CY102]|uniref:Ger(x)C family spore germination protein n=1 Tax=Paenibacillus sp. MMS18-CY102 TaxID=2682849 RepID=UPI0013662E18|nr:Ger(x)C family spore germination protein [Paenibacillus sp. MMS18-CY102]MWC28078.1 Ger(x)C family spore germination protein [Paenibacillus sp. MMS18-CY102]